MIVHTETRGGVELTVSQDPHGYTWTVKVGATVKKAGSCETEAVAMRQGEEDLEAVLWDV